MRYAVIGACFLLAGCITPGEVSDRAKEIQTYTRTICKFVPTLESVAKIISGGTLGSVTSIASDICLAVTTAPLADGPGDKRPYVNGVLVEGRFVR